VAGPIPYNEAMPLPLSHRTSRGPVEPFLFCRLTEQLANIRRWNDDREWGFTRTELAAVDLTERVHPDPLVVDLIAVYLPDEYRGEDGGVLDGVRRTCHELWSVVTERYDRTWSWDWVRDVYEDRPKPVRLLPGIVHRPGVRRVSVDLGAHWHPPRPVRPRRVRGPDCAHAELLAAAAHFPRWVRAMDGIAVPFVWLAGYQVTHPEAGVDERLLALAWVGYRRTLSLTVARADHSFTGWACPTVLDGR